MFKEEILPEGLKPIQVAELLGMPVRAFKGEVGDMMRHHAFPPPFLDTRLSSRSRRQLWSRKAIEEWIAERSNPASYR